MCTYNMMASTTKIIILITAIIVISGDALYVLGNDTNVNVMIPPDSRVSDTSSYVKQDPPYMRRCDNGVIDLFFGCTVTTVRSLMYPKDYYDAMQLDDPSSTNTENVISKNGGLRARRQALVKTKGSDDGRNAVIALLGRSNSPLRSIRNRNRRSSSIPETSANKKNKVVVRKTPVSKKPPKEPPIGKNLISMFLTTLYSPYTLIY